MGIRLEWFVILLIIITIGTTTVVKLTNTQEGTKSKSKELEFHKTAFTEVDTDKMQSKSFVQVGTRTEGVLTLKDLIYSTENITYLIADKAIYEKNILLLEGNVRLEETPGYTYTTEHAKYNQKSEVLTILSSFIAKQGKNIFKGSSLRYDSVKKDINATQVDAMIYTTEK
jgi:lipopolysaccharide assembly outer membrane protein LptD (OstA)